MSDGQLADFLAAFRGQIQRAEANAYLLEKSCCRLAAGEDPDAVVRYSLRRTIHLEHNRTRRDIQNLGVEDAAHLALIQSYVIQFFLNGAQGSSNSCRTSARE